MVTSTTTDTAGAFAAVIPSGSDVLLRSSFPQSQPTLVLPQAPPTADADLSYTMFTDQAFEQLGTLCPANPNGIDVQRGQVLVLVADATSAPQPGYTVTSDPPGEATCYPGSFNVPRTSSEGVAIVFDVTPGTNVVAATDQASSPPVRSRAWGVAAHSQSFIRLEVPPSPQP